MLTINEQFTTFNLYLRSILIFHMLYRHRLRLQQMSRDVATSIVSCL